MAMLIADIKPEYHNRIVIHSHYSLMMDFPLRGIHLTESQKRKKLRTWIKQKQLLLKNQNFTLSMSCHHLKELKKNLKKYAYVFLSPIFQSISKKNYGSSFDLSEVKRVLSKTEADVVALGGCEIANFKKIYHLGFSGAAVLGAVWKTNDPVQNFLNIRREILYIKASRNRLRIAEKN